MTYRTIHTTYGLRCMAQAEAAGMPVNLTHMAVGDGNGVLQTAASGVARSNAYDYDAVLFDAEGQPLDPTLNIDVIGTWYDVDNTNPEALVATAREGYYVNVRAPGEVVWPETVIQTVPVTPWRVWA